MDLPGPEPDDRPDDHRRRSAAPARTRPPSPAAAPDLERIAGDLADVEVALDRLTDGTYWTDEITGETIPDDVLAEDPTARRVAYVPVVPAGDARARPATDRDRPGAGPGRPGRLTDRPMKPTRVTALVVSALGVGAAGAVVKKKLGELMTWRSRRMWKLTARNAGRYAGTRARRIVTPAERRAELDTQFAIRTAEDVAKELGEMKGVLMKVGQMISFIAEGLPDEAQQALAALQADAAPMAPTLAASVIRDELGRDPERVFATWEDLPVAAASIGQVHRATDAGVASSPSRCSSPA